MDFTQRFRAIAKAYEAMPQGRTGDLAAERAYAAFARETEEQYLRIPVSVEPWPFGGQPYGNSREMFDDLDRDHLYVFTGGEDHPFLTRVQNIKFRAVHDYFGHFLERNQFGPGGEFRAWQAHCRMYSGEAIPALTAELLGQSCWFNFGPHAHLHPADRPYADQKASLLPDAVWRPLLRQVRR
jgi:hypothetical protein